MAGVRRLCAAIDVEGYSRRGALDEQRHIQSVLVRAVDAGLVSVPEAERQEQGDGQLIVFPAGIAEPTVIRLFLREFTAALARENRLLRPEARIRVRIALDAGLVQRGENGYVGDGAISPGRLCDSKEARDALAGSTGEYIVIVSRQLATSVRSAFGEDPAWRFQEAVAHGKNTVLDCLLHVPGAAAGPAVPEQRSGPPGYIVPPEVGLI